MSDDSWVDAWLGEDEDPGAPTSVYRLFDAEGNLLYVGITSRGYHRLHAHARDKAWWTDVASATFEHHPNRRAAATRETKAIRDENPRYNIARPRPGTRSLRGIRTPGTLRWSGPRWLSHEEQMALLDRQARRHFSMSGEELAQRFDRGEIAQDDERLRYVVNLLARVRVEE